MSTLFIVNRTAGNGRAGREWDRIYPKISRLFLDMKVAFTEYPGHASKLASESTDETIISCGGDGTLNEIVNGVAGKKVKIGIIPLGTGSDFGKTVGISELNKAISTIKRGKTKKIDVGKIIFLGDGNTRLFVNILEIGFGAEVMNFVNSHKFFGKLSFLLGVISVIRKLKRFTIDFNYDGNNKVDTIEVIVANGRYFGGGMLASPNSRIDDALLDLHILRPYSRIKTLLNLNKLISGKYISMGLSIEGRSERFTFLDKGNLIEVDGEVVGRTPIEVTVLPAYLEMILPDQ
ncbi:MAG: diacylglycerol kinase family lipid kinase [Thermoplasmatales archaeon]